MKRSERLAALQTAWRARGWYAGAIDGVWGNMSLAAAEKAQAALSEGVAARVDPVDPETALLIAELERDEGRVLHAYQDHLGWWTIGIGRLIDKRRGGGISNAEADLLKRNDIARVRTELDARLPWWSGLDPVRQRAVQNMAFQMGTSELKGPTYDLIRQGRYAEAAARLRTWKWVSQTPERAARVISMIEKGKA